MRSRSFGGSCIVLCLLPLAVALTGCASGSKGSTTAVAPASAVTSPPPAASNQQPAAGPDQLKVNRGVEFVVSYELPEGAKVTWEPDYQAGQCIKDQSRWVDTAARGDQGGGGAKSAVTFVNDWPESCGWQISRAWWNVTAQTGNGHSATARIEVRSGGAGVSKIYTVCQASKDIACTGGQARYLGDDPPNAPLYLGPMNLPPELSCAQSVRVTIGQPLNNLHVCTLEGYPRPTFHSSSLPPGVTLTRWPTEKDTWLVLNGTINSEPAGLFYVDARLEGWEDEGFFSIEVE
jgi:hypothetical protein